MKDEDKEEEVKEAQYAHPPPLDNYNVIGTNQCLCLPKAELNTKNFGWVFGVQFDSLEKK